MNKEKIETAEKEKLTQREGTLLGLGVLMGVFGGFVSSYLVKWSGNALLENPLFGSILVAAIFFAFFTLMFMLSHIHQAKEGDNAFNFLALILKSKWRWYAYFIIPVCVLVIVHLYTNPTASVV